MISESLFYHRAFTLVIFDHDKQSKRIEFRESVVLFIWCIMWGKYRFLPASECHITTLVRCNAQVSNNHDKCLNTNILSLYTIILCICLTILLEIELKRCQQKRLISSELYRV